MAKSHWNSFHKAVSLNVCVHMQPEFLHFLRPLARLQLLNKGLFLFATIQAACPTELLSQVSRRRPERLGAVGMCWRLPLPETWLSFEPGRWMKSETVYSGESGTPLNFFGLHITMHQRYSSNNFNSVMAK